MATAPRIFQGFRKGKTGQATKINANSYIVTVDNARGKNEKKVEGFTERFGRIFDPTKQEEAKFSEVASLEFLNALEKAGLT